VFRGRKLPRLVTSTVTINIRAIVDDIKTALSYSTSISITLLFNTPDTQEIFSLCHSSLYIILYHFNRIGCDIAILSLATFRILSTLCLCLGVLGLLFLLSYRYWHRTWLIDRHPIVRFDTLVTSGHRLIYSV